MGTILFQYNADTDTRRLKQWKLLRSSSSRWTASLGIQLKHTTEQAITLGLRGGL